MSEQAQQVPLIVEYKNQLAAFIQQRDHAKMQFEQLQGAIFACEQMIKKYEDSAKQTVMDLAKKVGSLTPNENSGAINDGETNGESEKKVAAK